MELVLAECAVADVGHRGTNGARHTTTMGGGYRNSERVRGIDWTPEVAGGGVGAPAPQRGEEVARAQTDGPDERRSDVIRETQGPGSPPCTDSVSVTEQQATRPVTVCRMCDV